MHRIRQRPAWPPTCSVCPPVQFAHLSGLRGPVCGDQAGTMPGEGFEPPTFGLQNRCTTTVLTRRTGGVYHGSAWMEAQIQHADTHEVTGTLPREAGPREAGPVEAGPVEAGPVEAGPVEAGPVEAGPVEAGRSARARLLPCGRIIRPGPLPSRQVSCLWISGSCPWQNAAAPSSAGTAVGRGVNRTTFRKH
jgi:hypothetical protein